MVAEALEARGFGAVKKVEPYIELTFKAKDYVAVIASALALLAVAWVLLSGTYSAFIAWLRGIFPRI